LVFLYLFPAFKVISITLIIETFMKNLLIALAMIMFHSYALRAAEATVVVPVPQTEQAQGTSTITTYIGQDYVTDDASEDAKKKRRKKRKKDHPIMKWVLIGGLAVLTVVIYVLTDGEGYHSR
jgi:hypothetical protein